MTGKGHQTGRLSNLWGPDQANKALGAQITQHTVWEAKHSTTCPWCDIKTVIAFACSTDKIRIYRSNIARNFGIADRTTIIGEH